jgi:hypothetical protein
MCSFSQIAKQQGEQAKAAGPIEGAYRDDWSSSEEGGQGGSAGYVHVGGYAAGHAGGSSDSGEAGRYTFVPVYNAASVSYSKVNTPVLHAYRARRLRGAADSAFGCHANSPGFNSKTILIISLSLQRFLLFVHSPVERSSTTAQSCPGRKPSTSTGMPLPSKTRSLPSTKRSLPAKSLPWRTGMLTSRSQMTPERSQATMLPDTLPSLSLLAMPLPST